MKSWMWIILTLIISVVLSGCSADEVIQVGTPFNNNGSEGVKFHKEIKDSESIEALRRILDKLEDIEEPNDLNKESETFFSLDRPKEGISERRLYVWYQEDGSSILYNDGVNSYFSLTKKQTNELKSILVQ